MTNELHNPKATSFIKNTCVYKVNVLYPNPNHSKKFSERMPCGNS